MRHWKAHKLASLDERGEVLFEETTTSGKLLALLRKCVDVGRHGMPTNEDCRFMVTNLRTPLAYCVTSRPLHLIGDMKLKGAVV